MAINPMKAGLACGVFLALGHLCWVILVILGQAQKLLDHVLLLHFITPNWHVAPFEIDIAIVLVGVSFGVGLLAGLAFAMIWNEINVRMP